MSSSSNQNTNILSQSLPTLQNLDYRHTFLDILSNQNDSFDNTMSSETGMQDSNRLVEQIKQLKCQIEQLKNRIDFLLQQNQGLKKKQQQMQNQCEYQAEKIIKLKKIINQNQSLLLKKGKQQKNERQSESELSQQILFSLKLSSSQPEPQSQIENSYSSQSSQVPINPSLLNEDYYTEEYFQNAQKKVRPPHKYCYHH